MTSGQFVALVATMFAIAIVPGPSDLLVVARSLASGFSHGVAVTVGIIAADYVFIVVAMLSLGFIAEALSDAFIVVQYACGLYLIGLGFLIWRGRHGVATVRREHVPELSTSFVAGFATTLGDPKAIAFYVGLLPAFVDLSAVTWREAALVMAAATVTIASIKLVYALLAARAAALLESRRARTITSAVAAAVSILVGAYLLIES